MAWQGVCATGKLQSPVNLPLAGADSASGASGASLRRVVAAQTAPMFRYGMKESVRVLNTGHGTPQVGAGGAMWVLDTGHQVGIRAGCLMPT